MHQGGSQIVTIKKISWGEFPPDSPSCTCSCTCTSIHVHKKTHKKGRSIGTLERSLSSINAPEMISDCSNFKKFRGRIPQTPLAVHTLVHTLVHVKNTPPKGSQYMHFKKEPFCLKCLRKRSWIVTISKISWGECPQSRLVIHVLVHIKNTRTKESQYM